MIKDLLKVANSLDEKGFEKEADEIDKIIKIFADKVGCKSFISEKEVNQDG